MFKYQQKNQIKKNALEILAVLVVAVICGVFLVQSSAQAEDSGVLEKVICKDQSGKVITPDTKVYNKHEVTGYFIYPTADQCKSRAIVEKSHKINADTLVTFGGALKSVENPASLQDEPKGANGKYNELDDFRDFKINNLPGYEYLKQALVDNESAAIDRVFKYTHYNLFHKNSMKCANKSGEVIGSKGTYTWHLLPLDVTDYNECNSPSKKYDLVVAYNPTKIGDADYNLLANAEIYGMKVYLGMPVPQLQAKPNNYLPDVSYLHTLGSFTAKVMQSWEGYFKDSPAFAGVYQSRETGMFSSKANGKAILSVYSLQNEVASKFLPKKQRKVIVSPYFMNDKVDNVASAMKHIVETKKDMHMILAPQDGLGTRKVHIDKVAALYEEAKKAGADELWGNIESFRLNNNGATPSTPATEDEFNAQISEVGPKVSKLISYTWHWFDKSGVPDKLLESADLDPIDQDPVVPPVVSVNEDLKGDLSLGIDSGGKLVDTGDNSILLSLVSATLLLGSLVVLQKTKNNG